MALLEGKVAFVTGAARGQGRSHALRLAGEGADILAIDALDVPSWLGYPPATKEDMAETVAAVEATGRRIIQRRCDVRDRAGLEEAVGAAVEAFGRLDVVVANAAIASGWHRLWEIPEDQWQEIIDVDLTGVWRTLATAIPSVIEAGHGGSVIVISSVAALKGTSNIGAYVAAKTGVIGLMQTAARELAQFGIRANAVCPTNVNTAMLHTEAGYRMFRPDLEHPTEEDVAGPLSRFHLIREPWVEPRDVSDAVLFLASDLSRTVTGHTLPVDLGGTLK